MHNNIAKHDIIKLACLLAATLVLTSCCTLVSAKTVKIRGTRGYIEAGSTMLLDGFNFPELIYRISDDLSYEWLNISFAKNGTINEGDASYITKLYKKSPKREIMFMGSKYHSLNPDIADTLTTYNTGPGGVGMVPVPTATPAATAIPEQTTKLATAVSVSGISQALPGFGALSLICILF